MRYLIFIISLLLFKCGRTPNNYTAENVPVTSDSIMISSDTTVGVIKISPELLGAEYIQKEYFVIINGDTSIFSCFVTYDTIEKNLSVNYVRTPLQKSDSLILLEDSSALQLENNKKFFTHKTYEGQLRGIQLLLNAISKQFDLHQLRTIRFGLSSVENLSNEVTHQYRRKFGDNIQTISTTKVADLISRSQFAYDLNRTLSNYNLKIKKIYIDGLGCIDMAQSSFQESPRDFSNCIFDGLVILSLVHV